VYIDLHWKPFLHLRESGRDDIDEFYL